MRERISGKMSAIQSRIWRLVPESCCDGLCPLSDLGQFQFQEKRSPPSAAGISERRGPEHPRARTQSWELGNPGLVLALDLQYGHHLGL